MPVSPGDVCGGTLAGVRARLDHVAALGVTCLWLTPIFPSPSHHGYDASDYLAVEPRMGTVEDLSALVADAHARGIRVLLDFVVNHVSSSHAAFGRAQADPRGARGPVVPVHQLARRVRDVLRRPRPPTDRQRRPGRPAAPGRGGPLLARRRRRRLPVRLRQRSLARVLERVPARPRAPPARPASRWARSSRRRRSSEATKAGSTAASTSCSCRPCAGSSPSASPRRASSTRSCGGTSRSSATASRSRRSSTTTT